MNTKKWSLTLLLLALATLILLASVTVVIDPFFHYHAPQKFLQYPLDDSNQRYLNDGIVKHFDYDALITGTCMVSNFKASLFNTSFDVNAVKVPFSGATFSEVTNNLQRAIDANSDLKLVIYAIDSWFFLEDSDAMRTDIEIPTYLYDSNPTNDVRYLLNKDTLCKSLYVLNYTAQGNTTTNFDDYSYWGNDFFGETSRQLALENYIRPPKQDEQLVFTEDLEQYLTQNLNKSLIKIVRANPQIQFIFFYPPYSILKWDDFYQSGDIERRIEIWRHASELLLAEENIQLYSFYTDFESVTNLDNYRDDVHYGDQLNDKILQHIANQEGLLTLENNDSYWKEVKDFYTTYNYDALFEEVAQNVQ